MKCLFIPREINKSYFLLWQRDEIVFLMLPFGIFLLIQNFIGFILTLVVIITNAMILKKIRVDKPRGYILHLVYYYLPRSKKISLLTRDGAFPVSTIRHVAG